VAAAAGVFHRAARLLRRGRGLGLWNLIVFGLPRFLNN